MWVMKRASYALRSPGEMRGDIGRCREISGDAGRYGEVCGEVELGALAAVAEEPIGDLDLVPLGQPAQLAFEGAELLGGQVHLAARVHVAPLDEAAVDAAERPARPVVVGHAGYG